MDDAANRTARVFRPRALEREFSSPGRLDELVDVTLPRDWWATLVVLLILAAVCIWGVVGRIPTRVEGEGILLGGGTVVDASSVVEGRLASVDVAVGDHVVEGQVIGRIAQTETEQRFHDAEEALHERERQYAVLVTANERETSLTEASCAAQQSRLRDNIALSEERVANLIQIISSQEELVARGLVTARELDQRRGELIGERQRIAEARTEIERLNAQILDLDIEHERARLSAEMLVNDARRRVEEVRVSLDRDTRLLAPSDGRIIETKLPKGAVLKVGTPVASIETEGEGLRAVVYVPAAQAKRIASDMEVRLAPSTARREEYGTLIGAVTQISDYPATPEGMAGLLHNDSVVARFGRRGPLHAVEVALRPDSASVSGYRWSSGAGPPFTLTSGTLVEAEITTREQPPISLIIPALKHASGLDW
jgi:HlyD family secretion protein